MCATTPKLDLENVGRTNLYHSDEERRLIDEAICRTTEALQRVREEKRALILCEDALQLDLDRYLSARAPIKRLPDNVLCNIFEWHCEIPSPTIPFSSRHLPPQITISHVCSAWRQIMLHIPAFWSDIEFEFDMTIDVRKGVDVAHAWLFRAKSLPCNVRIVFPKYISSEPDHLDRYRNVVKDTVSLFKLKRLDIISGFYHLQDLLQLPYERLCCIEALGITIRRPTGKTALPFKLHELSSLTSLSIYNTFLRMPYLFDINYQDSPWFASIPWHQLRHIRIQMAFPMPFCFRVLELCSAVLETFSLVVYVDSSFMSSPLSSLKEPVYCSQLRELKVVPSVTDSVSEADDINLGPFLCSFRCPKLRSLVVGSITNSGDSFISPPSNNLVVLPLLTSFPSLRRLVLPPMINFTQEAMDELGSGSTTPFLEYLIFKKPAPVSERLFQMIKTRSSVGKEDSTRQYKIRPFKTVILYCEGLERKQYSDTIKEINESGVKLVVCWERYRSELDDGSESSSESDDDSQSSSESDDDSQSSSESDDDSQSSPELDDDSQSSFDIYES